MDEKYRSLAKVAKVIDEFKCVINRGSNHAIEVGNVFLIFRLGDTISDPDTNRELGVLEIVLGRARAIHVQENISTLESSEKVIVPGDVRRIKRSRYSGIVALSGGPTEEEIEEGAQERKRELDVSVGDMVRPI